MASGAGVAGGPTPDTTRAQVQPLCPRGSSTVGYVAMGTIKTGDEEAGACTAAKLVEGAMKATRA